jgi:DNA-directed RNA polymerase specialized sigma24 family protein
VPEGTIKSRLSRAREALRRKLAGLLDGRTP